MYAYSSRVTAKTGFHPVILKDTIIRYPPCPTINIIIPALFVDPVLDFPCCYSSQSVCILMVQCLYNMLLTFIKVAWESESWEICSAVHGWNNVESQWSLFLKYNSQLVLECRIHIFFFPDLLLWPHSTFSGEWVEDIVSRWQWKSNLSWLESRELSGSRLLLSLRFLGDVLFLPFCQSFNSM